MRLFKRSGGRTWWVDLRCAGGRQRCSTGVEAKREALQVAKRLQLEFELGEPVAPVGHNLSMGHSSWSETLGDGRRQREEIKRVTDFVTWRGGDTLLSEVMTHDITRYLERELVGERGLSPSTVIRHRATLSKFFRWVRAYGLSPHNPVEGSWTPPNRSKRKTALTPHQVNETLLRVSESPLEGVYHLAFFAGLRREEISRARWEDVDFESRTLFVRGTKTESSEATLPLHRRLFEYLRGHPGRKQTGPIIANRSGGHYRPDSLQRLKSRHPSALPCFHQARHTLATVLRQEGVSLDDVKELLRHRSVSTTERFYAWSTPTSKASELDKFDV